MAPTERVKGALWSNRNKVSRALIGTALALGVTSEVLTATDRGVEAWASPRIEVDDHEFSVSVGIGMGKRTLVEDRLHMDGTVFTSPNIGDNFLGVAIGSRDNIGSGFDVIKEAETVDTLSATSSEGILIFPL